MGSNWVLYCNRDIPSDVREDFLVLIPPLTGLPFTGVALRDIVSSSLIADFISNRGGGV